MEPKLPPHSGPNLDKVTKVMRDLDKNTAEADVLRLVGYGSTVVVEFLGDNPQTKRIKLVQNKNEAQSDGVDFLIDLDSELGKKIYHQPQDGAEITLYENTRIRILEIIDPEIVKSSEPQ